MAFILIVIITLNGFEGLYDIMFYTHQHHVLSNSLTELLMYYGFFVRMCTCLVYRVLSAFARVLLEKKADTR